MNKYIASILMSLMMFPAMAFGEVSANFGWVSEYVYRGISQDDSSAYVGIDYEASGFYAGTWAADVGEGAEVDLYFGYAKDITDKLSFGIGATGYFYTDDFDDTYKELNVSIAHSYFSFDTAVGEYENFAGPTQDYSFMSLKGEYGNFYAFAGSFQQDFDGEYYEAGFSLDVGGFDVSIAIVHGTASLLGTTDNTILFGIGKTVDVKALELGSPANASL
jgi:uncharacterized protein (TIGR02001 family)